MNEKTMRSWLNEEDPVALRRLYRAAYRVKERYVGNVVYFRGIVEFSNVCAKNCFYCGIRRDNAQLERYTLTAEEILECAQWAHDQGYGSLVLQSGERTDARFVDFITSIVTSVKRIGGGALGVTLCLGEQQPEVYARWFAAGAHRYLLRIETSNPELYAKLHPEDHNFQARLDCLQELKRIGYQVGTGVMIGLPGQRPDDLAADLQFFKDQDIDMLGMGPYLPHRQTPLSGQDALRASEIRLRLGLTMIALARLHLKDVNIAATTALQALHPRGRELGLKAGANIIMPNITPAKYREAYQLYDGKPCLDENGAVCRGCLDARIAGIGESVGYRRWGDSPHFERR